MEACPLAHYRYLDSRLVTVRLEYTYNYFLI
jgi:hypothetical protein